MTAQALALFGLERARCHAACQYVFKSLDGDVLAKAFGEFARGDGEPGHIAIDGQTLKGSRRLGASRGTRHGQHELLQRIQNLDVLPRIGKRHCARSKRDCLRRHGRQARCGHGCVHPIRMDARESRRQTPRDTNSSDRKALPRAIARIALAANLASRA